MLFNFIIHSSVRGLEHCPSFKDEEIYIQYVKTLAQGFQPGSNGT